MIQSNKMNLIFKSLSLSHTFIPSDRLQQFTSNRRIYFWCLSICFFFWLLRSFHFLSVNKTLRIILHIQFWVYKLFWILNSSSCTTFAQPIESIHHFKFYFISVKTRQTYDIERFVYVKFKWTPFETFNYIMDSHLDWPENIHMQ